MFPNENDIVYAPSLEVRYSTSLKISTSSSAKNSILYGVPIAVLLNCLKDFLPKEKTLSFSTTFASLIDVEVLTFFSLLNSNLFCRADKPCPSGILEYMPTKPTECKIISLGKFFKELNFFRKSLESFV